MLDAPTGLAWTTDHPVLVELRRRRAAGSTPAERRAAGDPVKLGLAVEGGAMRGVVSAAMIHAIDDLGATGAFDAVYALSVGALNAAYMLQGDVWLPMSIYYDDLPNRRFVDFSRPLRGQSIIDLDYVFEDILAVRKPLHYEDVLSAGVPLHVGVTLVDRLETVCIHDFVDGKDLREALRATCWLPGAVQGTARFRGERAVDGGVLTAHPYQLAAEDGCTHVLSLSTHQLHAPRNLSQIALRGAYRYLERLKPGLGDGYYRSLEDNEVHVARLAASMNAPMPDPWVLDLGPLTTSPLVRRHETDSGRMIAAARNAYELMWCALEGHPVTASGVASVRAVPRFKIVGV